MNLEKTRYRFLYISMGYASQNNSGLLTGYLNNASGSDPGVFCIQNQPIF